MLNRDIRRLNRQCRGSFEQLERRALLATVTWDGGGDDSRWETAENWSSDQVPSAADDVVIDVPDRSPSIQIDTDVTVNRLNSTESLRINSGALTLTAGTSEISGSLTLEPGTTLRGDGDSQVNVSGATTANGAQLVASNGARLSMPALTEYTIATVRDEPRVFHATGPSSVLDLPALTSLSTDDASFTLSAQADGQILMPSLTSLTNVNAESVGRESHIDLSALTNWSGVGTRPFVAARSGGSIKVGFTAIENVDVDLASNDPSKFNGTIESFHLQLGPNSTLNGPGIIDGNFTNSGRVHLCCQFGSVGVVGEFEQTDAGSLELEIGGTSRGRSHDSLWAFSAILGGTLTLRTSPGYVPPSGAVFEILEADDQGIVDDFVSVNSEEFGGDDVTVQTQFYFQQRDEFLFIASSLVAQTSGGRGPEVISTTLPDQTSNAVSEFRVNFAWPVSVQSLNETTVTVTGPNGLVEIESIEAAFAPREIAARVDISLADQSTPGRYDVAIGPRVTSPDGIPMDQDGDGINGEPDDVYRAFFELIGFHVDVTSPTSGAEIREGDRVRFAATSSIDEPVDYAWTSSLDGQFGTSNNFVTDALTPGTHEITLLGRTADGKEDTHRFSLTVVSIPPAFSIEPIESLVVDELSTLSYQVVANQGENDQRLFYYIASGAPQGLSIDRFSGVLSWTPNESHGPGSFPVTVGVRNVDFPNIFATEPFRIDVAEVNSSPQLAHIDDIVLLDNDVVNVSLFARDSDIPEQELTFSLSPGAPPTWSIDNSNRTLVIDPQGLSDGTYRIELTVRDDAPQPAIDSVFFDVVVDRVRPNLNVNRSSIVAPAKLIPGETSDLQWDVQNLGNDIAAPSWSGQLSISPNSDGTDQVRLRDFEFEQTLNANQTETVALFDVLIPTDSFVGDAFLVIELDTRNNLVETDDNNFFVVESPIVLERGLSFDIDAFTLSEDEMLQAIVTRNGDLTEPLPIEFLNSANDRVQIPSISIPAGQNSVRFFIEAIENDVPERPTLITLEATADGYLASSVDLTLHDNDTPRLIISVSDELREGTAAVATITTDLAPLGDLRIELTSDAPEQLVVSSEVTIPAGQFEARFQVIAADDGLFEGTVGYLLSATAAGYQGATNTVTVPSNDAPELTITASSDQYSEGTFGPGLFATVTRTAAADAPLVVSLQSANRSRITVPNRVTIPAGQTSARFPVALVDDNSANGTEVVRLSASPVAASDDLPVVAAAVNVDVSVLDNDGATLFLDLGNSLITEDGETTVTVTRNTPTETPLSVSLATNDESEIVFLETRLVIPVGESSVSTRVFARSDSESDGSQLVRINGIANGFNTGATILVVSDVDLPDLEVVDVRLPKVGLSNEVVDFSWSVANLGNTPAIETWTQRVFLSDDETIGNDLLVSELTFSGRVPDGQSYDRSIPIALPERTGTFFPVLILDSENNVDEILETNNAYISPNAIVVSPAYTATVRADVESAPADSKIQLRGDAIRVDGTPAAFERVNIHLSVHNVTRVLPAITDAEGNYETVFTPLPKEGGIYSIGAAHPGEAAAPNQDSFSLVGMIAEPADLFVRINEQGSVVCDAASSCGVTVRNLADVELSDLSVLVEGAPDNLRVTASFGTESLPGLASRQLDLRIEALDPSVLKGEFRLIVDSQESPQLEIPVAFSVIPLRSRLAASVSSLAASMLVGDQTSVEFTIQNQGGKETGPLEIQLPGGANWLTLATAAEVASLPPDASATVSLLLTPPRDLDLTVYSGSLVVRSEETGIRMPFHFRAVSEEVGDVEVTVVDEFHYFTEERPTVSGASVILRDAITGQKIVSSDDFVPIAAEDGRVVVAAMPNPSVTIDENGRVTFSGVAEGPYTLEVRAADHESYQNTIRVQPGEVLNQEVFISRNLVEYVWTVEEIEIEDRTTVTIESVFETNVPAPVVTIEYRNQGEQNFRQGAVLDMANLTEIGQTMQVDMRITNHGLIAANSVAFNFGSHPFYEISPLIQDVGVLPAKSELIIPVIVRRVADFDSLSVAARAVAFARAGLPVPATREAAEKIPCSISASLRYVYYCGPNDVWKTIAIPVINVEGDCPVGAPSVISPPRRRADGPSGSGGTGIGGPGFVLPTAVEASEPNCQNSEADNPGLETCEIDRWELAIRKSGPVNTILNSAESLIESSGLVKSIDVGVEGKVGIETCCEGGEESGSKWYAEGAVTASASVEWMPIGLDIDVLENVTTFKGWQIDAEILAGLVVRGEIEGGGFVDANSKCGDYFDITGCGGISLSGNLEAAIVGGVELDFEKGGKEFEVVATAEIGLRASFDLRAQKCIGQTGCVSASVSPLEGFVRARFVVSSDFADLLGLADGVEVELEFARELTDAYTFSTCEPSDEAFAGFNSPAASPPYAMSDLMPLESLHADLGYENFATLADSLGFNAQSPKDIADEEWQAFFGGVVRQQGRQVTSGTCATVRLQLEQDFVQTRQGFRATLQMTNRNSSLLTGIQAEVELIDATGKPAQSLFVLAEPVVDQITSIDGNGTLLANATGVIEWTIIPTAEAALLGDTDYGLGGSFSFLEGDVQVTIPLNFVPITVTPQPEIELKYFHQRDVIADDPDTDVVEASEPFTLAVVARNVGVGTANNLRIESGQPKIVENEKGLLVDFEIVGAKVNGGDVEHSLTANLGDIVEGGVAIAEWQLESTLQGLFVEFEATFEHLNPLGERKLSRVGFETSRDVVDSISLIKSVEIHELIRTVSGVPSNGLPAFLTNDIPDRDDMPDTLHLSDGSMHDVETIRSFSFDSVPTNENFEANLITTPSSGWTYLRVDHPQSASGEVFELFGVERDGVPLPTANFWQTDRTLIGGGNKPTLENKIHILDFNSSGAYTLSFSNGDLTAPKVLSFGGIESNPIGVAIDAIEVTFSEPIRELSIDAIKLTKNGEPVAFPNATRIIANENSTFQISGLASATGDDAAYELSIEMAKVSDRIGNSGVGVASVPWIKGESSPALVEVIGLPAEHSTSGISQLDIVFTKPIDLQSENLGALVSLQKDGASIIDQALALQAVTDRSYRIELGDRALGDGEYQLVIDAAAIRDLQGNAGVGISTFAWSVDGTPPRLVQVIGSNSNPRNTVVQHVDVEFSEMIDLSTLDTGDFSLTRSSGETNLTADDERITFEHRFDNVYRIRGVNWAQGLEDTYTLFMRGSAITDLAGNAGVGVAETSWTIDFTPPSTATDLAVSTFTGSIMDGKVNALVAMVAGTVAEPGLTIVVSDTISEEEFVRTRVEGTSFELPIEFIASGQHRLRVRTIDLAGNASDSFIDDLFVENTPAIIDSIEGISDSALNRAPQTITASFTAPINPESFSSDALRLSRNGDSILLSEQIRICPIDATNRQFVIDGLETFVGVDGRYDLEVSAANVTTSTGVNALGSKSASWLLDTVAPTTTEIVLAGPQQQGLANVAVSVTGIDPDISPTISGSGIASYEIYAATDFGQPELIRTVAANDAAFTFALESKRSYILSAIAIDRAGNRSDLNNAPTVAVFATDIDPPSISVERIELASDQIQVHLAGADLAYAELFMAIDGGNRQSLGLFGDSLAVDIGSRQIAVAVTPIRDGNSHDYHFDALALDASGNIGATGGGQSIVATFAVPNSLAVESLVVNRGARQRFEIEMIDVTFNSSQEIDSLVATTINQDLSDDRIRIEFGDGEQVSLRDERLFEIVSNRLFVNTGRLNLIDRDGVYTISIDSDADGMFEATFEFHRLAADTNGDQKVDETDLQTIRRVRGSVNATDSDVNLDGRVDADDERVWYREIYGASIPGDSDNDGRIGAADVDRLCSAVLRGAVNPEFDLNNSGKVTRSDLDYLLEQIALTSRFDITLDGSFGTQDLIEAFRHGTYEDSVDGNALWSQGDWNCDGDFGTGDLVAALANVPFEAAKSEIKRSHLPAITGEDGNQLEERRGQVERRKTLNSRRMLAIASDQPITEPNLR